MKRIWLTMVLVGLCCGVALAEESVQKIPKFKVCANQGGAGFFWVDTASGKTWVLDAANVTWRYLGQPEGAKDGENGTFMPHENRSGVGVFILNVSTGEGWWTDGAKWKLLGVPKVK